MNTINYFEFIAMGCSLFLLHPMYAGKRLWLVSLAMLVTVVAELMGYYLRVHLRIPNHNIYNVSVPVIILIFQLLFFLHLKSNRFKKRTLWLGLVFILFCIINFLFIQGITRFATYNYIAGGLFLTVITSFYFIELIREPKYLSLFDQPLFWCGSGILIMYIPKMVLYSLFVYWAYRGVSHKEFTEVYTFLNTVLSVVFYSLISIASLCKLVRTYLTV